LYEPHSSQRKEFKRNLGARRHPEGMGNFKVGQNDVKAKHLGRRKGDHPSYVLPHQK
jgi:hypothetical protein